MSTAPISQEIEEGRGQASMVLGIIGMAVPFAGYVCAIIAIRMAKKAEANVDEYNRITRERLMPSGMAKAGKVLGIISVSLHGIFLLPLLGLLALQKAQPTYIHKGSLSNEYQPTG